MEYAHLLRNDKKWNQPRLVDSSLLVLLPTFIKYILRKKHCKVSILIRDIIYLIYLNPSNHVPRFIFHPGKISFSELIFLLTSKNRVEIVFSSLIKPLHIYGIHVTAKHKIIFECISISFIIYRNNVFQPCLLGTEPSNIKCDDF